MVYESVGNTGFTLNGLGFQTIALTFGYLGFVWDEKPSGGQTGLRANQSVLIEFRFLQHLPAVQTQKKSR